MIEEEIQRNAVYLHEAGHAVVAVEMGEDFISVHCDGQHGYAVPAKKTSQPSVVDFMAYWGSFVTRMGGIAGESLELGRGHDTVFRAGDDISTFYGLAIAVNRSLGHDIQYLQDQMQDALLCAKDIVKRREVEVRAVAEALKLQPEMTKAEVLAVMQRALAGAAAQLP